MLGKGQWVVLPYLVDKELPGLSFIPTEVKGEGDRQPRRLGNYSYYNINVNYLPIDALPAMKYG